jgi:hypothetical protein
MKIYKIRQPDGSFKKQPVYEYIQTVKLLIGYREMLFTECDRKKIYLMGGCRWYLWKEIFDADPKVPA